MTSIEGISQRRLSNGVQVLLLPDPGQSSVTVNMTVFVGSRHEDVGQAGMAHLLEHMLFKGTPTHPNIPQLMKVRGARFNGTTWLDRTNYYETLPATNSQQAAAQLEFALALEADRLVSSSLLESDLAAEMTVVGNEIESGENNPRRILTQRVQAAAYNWHGYGRATIGNRADILRTSIDDLRDFYRLFYRPDNIMLVLAGNVEPDVGCRIAEKHFGALTIPDTPLKSINTVEPAQDGERAVVLRRAGNTQWIQAAYHVPPAAHEQFAAIELLAILFGSEPSGRLHQQLVVPQLASRTSVSPMALHDPGLLFFSAQVPLDKSLDAARDRLLEVIEGVADNPVSELELQRAKNQFLKDHELRADNSTSLAIELSEWAAQGDWRLYFWFRDAVRRQTVEDCNAAAAAYLQTPNRTLGCFLPTDTSQPVHVPVAPDVAEMLSSYVGHSDEPALGEVIDPTPESIESRVERGRLSGGLHKIWLPKRTRGGAVHLRINLRYGNEQSLRHYVAALPFLPEMLLRGTMDLDYQQLEDRLDDLRTEIRASGTTGLVSLSVVTKSRHLRELMPLLGSVLRTPRFDADELQILRRQAISSIEASATEPGPVASLALRRCLAPFPSDDPRYVPTLEERIERAQSVTVEELAQLHANQLGGVCGECAVLGDFDVHEMERACQNIFDDWEPDVAYERIPVTAQTQVAGGRHQIRTPGKPNAVIYGGLHVRIRDDDPEYSALLVGNYILGGSALSSRLGNRVRQQEGLSYGIGSSWHAHPIDQRANFTLYAITNAENHQRLVDIVLEEIELLHSEGITNDELAAAQQGLLEGAQLERSQDHQLPNLLAGTAFAGRDMRYYATLENQISQLTVEHVTQSLRRHLDLQRLVMWTAGDLPS